MAATLKIREPDSNELNLLKPTAGTEHVWTTKGGFKNWSGGAGKIWSTVDFVAIGNISEVIQSINSIETALKGAEVWETDETESTPYLLIWNADGEPAKSFILYGGELEVIGTQAVSPASADSGAIHFRIAFLRSEAADELGAKSTLISESQSALGGSIAFTAVPEPGSNISRLSDLVVGFSPQVGTDLTDIWLGVRRARDGNSSFRPRWEAEFGHTLGGSTTGSDSTATNGEYVQLGNNASMTRVFEIMQRDVWTDLGLGLANLNHMAGKYTLLARMRRNGDVGTQMAVQANAGFVNNPEYTEPIGLRYLDGGEFTGDWKYVDFGEFTLPFGGNRDKIFGAGTADDAIQWHQIQLYAKRFAGTGSFQIDHFVLMPRDALIVAKNFELSGATGEEIRFYTTRDWKFHSTIIGPAYGFGLTWGNLEASFHNWWLPPGVNGNLVIAANGAKTLADIDDGVDVTMLISNMWSSYRGVF